MPASPDAAVDVRGVSKVFGARTALDGFTLQIAAGEIVALLGPNGAGKTTAMRILAGLVAPTTGTGVVAGVRLDAGSLQPLRARVGVLTETPGLWDWLTVRMNLLTYARLYGVPQPAGPGRRRARSVRPRRSRRRPGRRAVQGAASAPGPGAGAGWRSGAAPARRADVGARPGGGPPSAMPSPRRGGAAPPCSSPPISSTKRKRSPIASPCCNGRCSRSIRPMACGGSSAARRA